MAPSWMGDSLSVGREEDGAPSFVELLLVGAGESREAAERLMSLPVVLDTAADMFSRIFKALLIKTTLIINLFYQF